jgi:hypothetical protein
VPGLPESKPANVDIENFSSAGRASEGQRDACGQIRRRVAQRLSPESFTVTRHEAQAAVLGKYNENHADGISLYLL